MLINVFVVFLENGADLEFLSCEPVNENPNGDVEQQIGDGQLVAKAKFKKGHKRAWSMPNAHHRDKDKALLVVAENNYKVKVLFKFIKF